MRLMFYGIVLVTLSLMPEVYAMSLFSKLTIFSEVKGTISIGGKPVVGADVERAFHSTLRDEKQTDHATSDVTGRFSFPKIIRTPSLLGLLPHEPVIGQKITIRYLGKEYLAWQFTKHNYDDNGELAGKQIDITCELTNAPTNHGDVYGVCTFR
jgi:hypothetical protein